MAKARPILLACVSDTHVNSTVGLCPPEGVKLQDGGTYHPSKVQEWTWQCWESFWRDCAEMRRACNARLDLIVDGDSTDGDHHHTTQIISGNLETQAYLTERVFGVPKKLRPDKTFLCLGTEAHTGPGGSADAALARHLHADRDPDDDQWGSLHIRLNANGLLVDVRHVGRTSGRPWLTQSALANLAAHIWTEHKIAEERHPDLAIRAHKHVYGDSGPGFPTRVVALPSWQIKTIYGHGVAPESLASLGGVLILVMPDGTVTVTKKLYKPALPKVRMA